MTVPPSARARIVVVTYFPGDFLDEFLASLPAASRQAVPVTVVDNGSPTQLIERYGRDTMEEVFLDIARGVDEPARGFARDVAT